MFVPKASKLCVQNRSFDVSYFASQLSEQLNLQLVTNIPEYYRPFGQENTFEELRSMPSHLQGQYIVKPYVWDRDASVWDSEKMRKGMTLVRGFLREKALNRTICGKVER